MVRYGSLVEGKLSASLLSPLLCVSGSKIDQENDDKDINDDGGDDEDSDGGDYDDGVVIMVIYGDDGDEDDDDDDHIGRLSPSLHKQDYERSKAKVAKSFVTESRLFVI